MLELRSCSILLSVVKPPLDDTTVTSIVEALTEKTYAHGHGIGRREARLLGLRVEDLDGDVDKAIWNLYTDYEKSLALEESGHPSTFLTDPAADKVERDSYEVGYVESETLLHAHSGTLEVQRIRKTPPQLNLNLNLSLQLPAGVQPAQLPPQTQQLLQQMVQQALPQLQKEVDAQIRSQSPVERIDFSLKDARWRQI